MSGSKRQGFDHYWTEDEHGCHVWVGGKNAAGYGYYYGDNHKMVRAHRYAYERSYGPIPDGMQLDHLCRNRACVNPNHLEVVTPAENQRRRPDRGDFCQRGHNNWIIRKDGRGRECRECKRLRAKAATTTQSG